MKITFSLSKQYRLAQTAINTLFDFPKDRSRVVKYTSYINN